MEASYSKASLLQFLDVIGSQGLANPSTAQSIRVACGKILDDLSDAEEADVRKVDIPLTIRKFNNKNPGVLSPSSLGEYQRRVGLAIREFDLYLKNPTTYRGFGRPPAKGDAEKTPGKRKESGKPATPDQITAYASPSPSTTSAGLSFAFPLRADFLAQLVLPRDMKTEEAHRLCAFIKALAVDSAPTA